VKYLKRTKVAQDSSGLGHAAFFLRGLRWTWRRYEKWLRSVW